MTPSSDNTLYVSHSGETLLEKTVSSRRDTWWGRVPASVNRDLRLKDADIRVLVEVSLYARHKRSGEPLPVSIGIRYIAESIGKSPAAVARSLERLIDAGHLIRQDGVKGKRAQYMFTSPVFLKRDYREEGVVVQRGYSGVPKYVGKVVPEARRAVRAPKVEKVEAEGMVRRKKREVA